MLFLSFEVQLTTVNLLHLVNHFTSFKSLLNYHYLTKSFLSPLPPPPELIFHLYCHSVLFESFIPIALMAFHLKYPFIYMTLSCYALCPLS